MCSSDFSGEARGRSFLRRALLIVLGAVISYYALAAQAQADIRFVQQNYALSASGQTVTVNFTNPQTAGNFNIVVVGWNDVTAGVTSVKDSLGTTYQLAVGPTKYNLATDGGGNLSQSIYYAAVPPGGGANTVTVTFSQAPQYPDIRIMEFSGVVGLDPAGPSKATAGASGNSAISSAGPVTTTNAYDLILGANMTFGYTSGPGTGFTNIVITDPDGDIAEYKIASSAGSYSATAPMASDPWVMQTVAFQGVPTSASVIGKWTTQTALAPINPVHSALLKNGKILIVAGSGNCPPSQTGCPPAPPTPYSAYVYDPVAGTLTQNTQITWDMFCNGAALLATGQVLFAGGTLQYDPFYGSPNAAIFDPSQPVASAFTNTKSMADGRWYPTLTTLPNGQVMAFSGLNKTGSDTNRTVEIYNPASSTWSSPVGAGWRPSLYPRMHVLPNGQVFFSGPDPTSYLFNPSSNTWSHLTNTNYPNNRAYGTSVLLPLTPAKGYDPNVMILGGDNPATATTEIIDLGAANPTWKYGPNMSQPRIEMNAVILPTGKILALGGSSVDEAGQASLNADLYDPVANTFSSAGANAYARLYHSVALLLPNATVWVAGGNPTRGTYEQHMEIYQPPYLFTSSGLAKQPSIGSGTPTSIAYGSQFTVKTTASSIASVVLVRMGAVTHAFNTDQRLVGMSFASVTGGLNVTAPPNSNVAPPGYYMLFIVDNFGVPSVAWIVQLHS